MLQKKDVMDGIVGKAADAEGIPASKGSAGGETPVLDNILGKDVMDGLRGQAEKGGRDTTPLNQTPIKAGTEAESGALIDADTNKNMINPPESPNQQAGTNLAGKDPAAEIMGYLEAEEGRGTESGPSLEAMIEEAAKNERGMSAAEEDAAAGRIMEELTGEKIDGDSRDGIMREGGAIETIPDNAKEIANKIKANNGAPPQGYKGGKVYRNNPTGSAQRLPEGINYKEYDVNPYIKGQNRGVERIVIGDDGSVWYTNNHYETFTKIEWRGDK